MPIYCNAQALEQGEIFLKCGTQEISKIGSKIKNLDNYENSSLVYTYSWDIQSSSQQTTDITMGLHLTVPNYPPIVSSLYNIMNINDKIKELKLYKTGSRNGRSVITNVYTAKKGQIVSASESHDAQRKDGQTSDHGYINIFFTFDEMTHDNKITNSLGYVRESNTGIST